MTFLTSIKCFIEGDGGLARKSAQSQNKAKEVNVTSEN